tara:strand:- start:360 stop:1616 length:1257 start_codon:yes stop_codon:yes gene_type:complete
MSFYDLIDHFIEYKTIYIRYTLISIIIAIPVFFYLKSLDDNKGKFVKIDYVIQFNNEINQSLYNIYREKNDIELMFTLIDDQLQDFEKEQFEGTNILNFSNLTQDVDAALINKIKDDENSYFAKFLQEISSEVNFVNLVLKTYDDDFIKQQIDSKEKALILNELINKTNILSSNADFRESFENLYEGVKLSRYIQIKIELIEFMIPKHIEFIDTLLDNAQTQVKGALINETNAIIDGLINRQNIKLRDLRVRAKEDKLKYINSLIDKKSLLEEKLVVAKELGITRPILIDESDSIMKNYPSVDTIFMGSNALELEIEGINNRIEDAKSPKYTNYLESIINRSQFSLNEAEKELNENLKSLEQSSEKYFNIDSHEIEFTTQKSTLNILLYIFAIQIFFLMILFFYLNLYIGYKDHKKIT